MDGYPHGYPKIVVRIEGPATKDERDYERRTKLAELDVEVDWSVVWPLYLDIVQRATSPTLGLALSHDDSEQIKDEFRRSTRP